MSANFHAKMTAMMAKDAVNGFTISDAGAWYMRPEVPKDHFIVFRQGYINDLVITYTYLVDTVKYDFQKLSGLGAYVIELFVKKELTKRNDKLENAIIALAKVRPQPFWRCNIPPISADYTKYEFDVSKPCLGLYGIKVKQARLDKMLSVLAK